MTVEIGGAYTLAGAVSFGPEDCGKVNPRHHPHYCRHRRHNHRHYQHDHHQDLTMHAILLFLSKLENIYDDKGPRSHKGHWTLAVTLSIVTD